MSSPGEKHIYLGPDDPVGGWVCATCGVPTESEPCAEHGTPEAVTEPEVAVIPGQTTIDDHLEAS